MFGDRRAGEFSFREHLELIRTGPGMYGLAGSYGNCVTSYALVASSAPPSDAPTETAR